MKGTFARWVLGRNNLILFNVTVVPYLLNRWMSSKLSFFNTGVKNALKHSMASSIIGVSIKTNTIIPVSECNSYVNNAVSKGFESYFNLLTIATWLVVLRGMWMIWKSYNLRGKFLGNMKKLWRNEFQKLMISYQWERFPKEKISVFKYIIQLQNPWDKYCFYFPVYYQMHY